MLQIKDLTIDHTRDLRTILKGFSCTLNAGDKAVIIGEEGNGKSTLLKWLYCPALIEDYAEAEGERITSSERLAYLPQFLSEEDAKLSVYGFFSGEAAFAEASPKELTRIAKSLGLDPELFYSEQLMGSLSGGEKVKVQLARMLLTDPTALLLDEPSNDIDIPTLESIEKLINGFRGIVLFISHDETLIERTANMVIHLEQVHRKQQCRHTVARVPYAQYVKDRLAAFNKQAQMAQSDLREKRIRDEKYRQIAQRVEHEQNVISRGDPAGGRLLKKKMHAVISTGKRLERDKGEFLDFPEEEEAILTRFDDDIRIPSGQTGLNWSLDCLQAGDRVLARDLRLYLAGSGIVGIVGRNGAGKTTLLHCLWEELRQRKDIVAAYMPQDYREILNYAQTPVEHLTANYTKDEITRARTCLGSMRFTHEEMLSPIGRLSGGQRAKLLFLDMVLKKANVLLLDEPTRNFSPLSAPVVRRALRDFGGAIISVSHDRKYLSEVCDAVYVLQPDGLFPAQPV